MCTHDDNNEALSFTPPVVELKVPTGIYSNGDQLRISVMLSHQFYTIESKAENKGFIELIKKAINYESLLAFYIKEGTKEIQLVREASAEDTSRFKAVFSLVKGETAFSKLEPIIPNPQTLNGLFAKIQNASCSFPVKKPCISFDYPVDGCYARAHKMRQLINENGYECKKEFVYGDLRARYGVKMSNQDGCCVSWSYHVAVLLTYKDEKGVLQECIIDPSLFDTPISDSDWRKACANSSCGPVSISSFTTTPGNVYYRSPKGTLLYDDGYVNTDCVLDIFADYSGCYLPAPSTVSCGF
nr:protein glutaminase [synthetic construct]